MIAKVDMRYIGNKTIDRMSEQRIFHYARFIEEILYNTYDIKEDKDHIRIPSKIFAKGLTAFGKDVRIDESYVDTMKGLREIISELEGIALKEVT